MPDGLKPLLSINGIRLKMMTGSLLRGGARIKGSSVINSGSEPRMSRIGSGIILHPGAISKGIKEVSSMKELITPTSSVLLIVVSL